MTKARLSPLLILYAATETATARPLAELVTELERLAVEHEVATFGFALVEGDAALWAGARSTTDHVPGAEVDPETVFRVSSITKAFTALALLTATGDSAVALETPMADLMDNTLFTNPWAPAHPIRLVHLLEHSAGFVVPTTAKRPSRWSRTTSSARYFRATGRTTCVALQTARADHFSARRCAML